MVVLGLCLLILIHFPWSMKDEWKVEIAAWAVILVAACLLVGAIRKVLGW